MPEKMNAFITKRRSQGGYSFTLDEVRIFLGVSENAVTQAIFRYQKKGLIALVRNGFYVIIPPEYSQSGMLPCHLYIDQLMAWLKKPYYLALFTAAALHGAGHQQPMASSVMTVRPPLRSIKNSKNSILFPIAVKWDEQDIEKKKTDAGYVRVSSPELTALDLMYYLRRTGINRCATVIGELAEVLDPEKLRQTAQRYPHRSAVQRLGYLLELTAKNAALATALAGLIAKRNCHYLPLSPHHNRIGEHNGRWKIIMNIKVENEP